jgi:hypothetical protein
MAKRAARHGLSFAALRQSAVLSVSGGGFSQPFFTGAASQTVYFYQQ